MQIERHTPHPFFVYASTAIEESIWPDRCWYVMRHERMISRPGASMIPQRETDRLEAPTIMRPKALLYGSNLCIKILDQRLMSRES